MSKEEYFKKQMWKLHYLKAVRGLFKLGGPLVTDEIIKSWLLEKGFLGTIYCPAEVILIGEGFDVEKAIFNIVLESSRQITAWLDPSFDLCVRDTAKQYKQEDIVVTLVGIAKYQSDGTIQHLEKLQHLSIFKDGKPQYFPDPEKAFEEFKALEDGWFEEEGTPFLANDLDSVKKWLCKLLNYPEIPAPFLYPTPDNAIEAEWSFGFWEIVCSFDFNDGYVYLHATRVNNEETREDKFQFKNIETVFEAYQFLKSIV